VGNPKSTITPTLLKTEAQVRTLLKNWEYCSGIRSLQDRAQQQLGSAKKGEKRIDRTWSVKMEGFGDQWVISGQIWLISGGKQ